MSSDFNTWWRDIGSGIRPLARHDYEQHGQRISMLAWNDSSVRATADITRLRAEVAALKANDPLAEMWRELEAYQEQANRDGHGESWRRMCEERTQAAACNAAHAAREFSRESAWSASYAVREAAQMSATAAIAAIRRAKEGQR
jgi:acetoin utilization deacetylase AcuC-like enzyme